MTNVIGFLEALGRTPAFPQAASAAWAALDGLAVGEDQRKALADADAGALNTLLGGRAFMALHILAPDGDEGPSRDAPDDGEAEQPGTEEPGEMEKPG